MAKQITINLPGSGRGLLRLPDGKYYVHSAGVLISNYDFSLLDAPTLAKITVDVDDIPEPGVDFEWTLDGNGDPVTRGLAVFIEEGGSLEGVPDGAGVIELQP